MSRADESIQAFLAAVKSIGSVWSAVDVRSAALLADADWCNLVTRCRLDSRAPDSVPLVPHLPVTERFACYQMVRPADELSTFLDSVSSGGAEVAGVSLTFSNRDNPNSQPVPYSQGSLWVASRGMHHHDFERFSAAHRLTLYGEAQGGLMRRACTDREALDLLVTSLDHPWDGLDGLTRYALRTTTRIDSGTLAVVEVVAPIEARLEHCDLRAGKLEYVVSAASKAMAEQCDVGLFAIKDGGSVLSETQKLPVKSWRRTDNGYQCTQALRLRKAQNAILLLRVGPFLADRQTVSDPTELGDNARLIAYAQFDEGLQRLNQILKNPKGVKKETEFHSAVARLFTFAGFYVDNLVADSGLTGKGIPDFLAHAPRYGSLLVVECTLQSLAGARDKLSQLVTRAAAIQEALAAGTGERVLAVIVTALPELPQHEMEAARRNKVAVLTGPRILELLQLAREQAPLESILAWLRAKVPTTDPMKLL